MEIINNTVIVFNKHCNGCQRHNKDIMMTTLHTFTPGIKEPSYNKSEFIDILMSNNEAISLVEDILSSVYSNMSGTVKGRRLAKKLHKLTG